MTAVLELNDLELTLHKGTETRYQTPAMAIVREDELIFGERAVRLARIHPQQANQQYFNRMNGDPLPQPIRKAANHADLVYLHLKELAEKTAEDTVLAVPGTLNGDQLGVLLGICQEAGIEVSGFVNSAVASLTTTPTPEQVTYLDVYLQHMLLSEVRIDDEVRHERSFEVRDCGFTNLVDGWMNLVADRFVQETRFDPLHTAASEQQLYNQVYDWVLGAHVRTEVAFQVAYNDQQRRVEVPRSQLEQKSAQRIDRLIDALPARQPLVLSARAARMPGLTSHLKRAGFELILLAADAVAAGCNEHMPLVRTVDSELRLVSRLPHSSGAVTSNADVRLAPTHLLKDNLARPLNGPDTPAVVQRDNGLYLVPAANLTLNDASLTAEARIELGDVVGTSDGSFTAIRLEP
jgi:hypothetical protein